MSDHDCPSQLAEAQETIRTLQTELAETNRGLLALTLELEQRVEERTAELRAAQKELEKTNSELLQLTLELEDRVAQRTAELRAKREELLTLSEQLVQASKLATMGELAAGIAHELNNPLATIGLRVEGLLLQISEEDSQWRALEIIQQEVERMGSLVANLLQFSRRSAPQISSLNVCEEIERTIELIHYRLRNHRVKALKEFMPSLPIIHGDRQQLRQLFLNLFNNAIDAMRDQGGTLRIGVALVTREGAGQENLPAGSQVVIEVVDTGTGIAPEHLPKLMEPFFTTKPEGQGTGLGLSICRRIVYEHHGTMNIASEFGTGTTVRVALPVTSPVNGAHLRAS